MFSTRISISNEMKQKQNEDEESTIDDDCRAY